MRRNIKKLRERALPFSIMLRNLISRMTIEATAAISTWDLLGFIDGEDNEESDDEVEVFQGVGFVARPPDDANAEVIVANVGAESNHPVVVAARDEETRAANVTDVEADESVAFNSVCRLHLKADGTLEARTHGGVAVALCLKSDLDSHKSHFDGHRHDAPQASAGSLPTSIPSDSAAGALIGSADPAPAPVGTAKLKGE